jgi:hypothetical protein
MYVLAMCGHVFRWVSFSYSFFPMLAWFAFVWCSRFFVCRICCSFDGQIINQVPCLTPLSLCCSRFVQFFVLTSAD